MFLAWFHVPVTVTEWLWERYGICKTVSTSVTMTNRGHNFLYDIVAWSIRHIISSNGTTQTTDTTWCVHQATSVINVETIWYLVFWNVAQFTNDILLWTGEYSHKKHRTHSQTVVCHHGSHLWSLSRCEWRHQWQCYNKKISTLHVHYWQNIQQCRICTTNKQYIYSHTTTKCSLHGFTS